MRAVETAAMESRQVTGLELMERAGAGVVKAILSNWPEYRGTRRSGRWRATILCGPGNNGGDGYVVARLLSQVNWEVTVLAYGDPARLPPDARANHDRWRKIGPVGRLLGPRLLQADVLVDALFGTGLTRPVDELAPVFEDIHAALQEGFSGPNSPGIDRLVAIDVPSGLDADSGRRLCGADEQGLIYDLTVTFHRRKIGHLLADGPELSGRLHVVDIGLEPWQRLADDSVLPAGPDARLQKRGGHKYDHGHALILGGGAGRGGAARLAARAALRSGAGLVTLGVPPEALPENAARLDAVMLAPLADAQALEQALRDSRLNAICLGPALGLERARELVPVALAAGRATLLDADALSAFAGLPDALFSHLHERAVLTPHEGEFARLFPDLAQRLAAPAERGPAFSRLDAARMAAARAGCTVLLKGPDTVIATPRGQARIAAAVGEDAAPWLATAGSGDVLAGIVTGLLARSFAPLDAAATGAWLHAEAARRFGPGLIAEDLPEILPQVFRRLDAEASLRAG
ncbi:yjeF C-terminal region, hydroxyethylthiazole kinase-related/yjeF N-terminal region [Paracoccus halophilus]|uniref:Bifunctional NAD(P)H-hydrate repair enzyme n=1 Tax=Paracoccus halophilus TaxID=376733 RepID=A0A099F1S6_9RHOB|nr:bifunctional ADP-dependent NAD(P)H-hydrate dehydratase/NAD(P)H-hydrate epimerase [Paracoccus halophilus]KGJ04092.1 hypothetical protein IT41_11310 [Paracoccus halophilus]SFA56128.1 yjeF C-terminal region, hydroxyethylthiazole kinase-related/yjeF N-terminal region [Paracoccus halophilus]